MNNLVNKVLVTTILDEIDTDKDELDTHTTTIDIFSNDLSEIVITLKKLKRSSTKRRKITKKQFLHSHLQICILFNFLSVKSITEDVTY